MDKPASLKLEDQDLPKMDGATALYPLYAAFAQATYLKKEYPHFESEVMASTTPEAYNRLFNGEADIIFANGPSNTQKEYAERKGIELKMTPIGREAFVFFVNAKNPVKGLKSEDIKQIYSGSITNWREVGGKNDKIRAFQRPEDSGSQTALQHFMGDTPVMDPPSKDVVTGMGGIIHEVSVYQNYKNAIGYTFRYYSNEMVQNKEIRLLEIDGVKPTKETIRTSEYPLASEFYAITAGSGRPQLDAFLEWILSEEGQAIVEKTGYVSIK
ncbi:MAG TPA: PstS family phosphate ABC transporter substrate-binding protein [Bacillaceae bacterium]